MKINKNLLKLNNNLYKKLENTCNYCNVKLEVIKGIVFSIDETNIS